jgi:hypothetical protein
VSFYRKEGCCGTNIVSCSGPHMFRYKAPLICRMRLTSKEDKAYILRCMMVKDDSYSTVTSWMEQD